MERTVEKVDIDIFFFLKKTFLRNQSRYYRSHINIYFITYIIYIYLRNLLSVPFDYLVFHQWKIKSNNLQQGPLETERLKARDKYSSQSDNKNKKMKIINQKQHQRLHKCGNLATIPYSNSLRKQSSITAKTGHS